jgi:hypothetical protein
MTADDGEWLNFHYAANEIKAKLGVSIGKAQSQLRQLCANGEIRSQKQPYVVVYHEAQMQGPPERIEPSEWRDREVDLMTDNYGCWYFVDVNKDDFQYWLNQQKAEAKEIPPRQQLVIKYLKEWYPNGVPDPSECPRKDLWGRLRKCDPNLKSLDLKTLRSAIARMGNDGNPTVSC